MVVPVLIFLACIVSGTVASARWLPELPKGTVAGLAFFVVCGLLGAALSTIGLHIYSIARELEQPDQFLSSGYALAGDVMSMLMDAGTLAGLAAILYLLAYKQPVIRVPPRASATTAVED